MKPLAFIIALNIIVWGSFALFFGITVPARYEIDVPEYYMGETIQALETIPQEIDSL